MNKLFDINTTDPTPIYAQLERAIKFAIKTGALSVGDQLPTVRQLAVDLKINANTVAKVYSELERTGVVETRRGIGTFICKQDTKSSRRKLSEPELHVLANKFIAEATSLGFSIPQILEYLKNWYDSDIT